MPVTKRPESSSPPATDAATPAKELQQYGLMWYKNTTRFGVRQRFFAKKQIFTVAHPGNDWPKDRLEKIANEAIKKLNAGEGESKVKEWVFSQTDRA